MGIFILVIGIIEPLSHFDCSKIKVSLVIKIIKFNQIKNMVHLVMLVIFHMNVITCQNFNLPHIYYIFVRKTHFFKWKFSMVSGHGSNYAQCHGSI